MYNCMIFDIDGTILDTKKTALLALQQAYYLDSGHLLPLSDMQQYFGVTNAKAARMLNVDDPEKFVSEIDNQYQRLTHNSRVFPDMEEVLERLFQMGLCMGVVTSKTIWEYEHDFQIFGLTHYFSQAVCVEHTQHHKPHPEPLERFFTLSGADKKDALFIGDTMMDAQCAQAAGVDFAMAGWGAARELPARYHLRHPRELLDLAQPIRKNA